MDDVGAQEAADVRFRDVLRDELEDVRAMAARIWHRVMGG